jgi:hypothetical protein
MASGNEIYQKGFSSLKQLHVVCQSFLCGLYWLHTNITY